MIIDKANMAIGAVGGAALTFLAYTAVNTFVIIPRAAEQARLVEGARLTAATDKAIGELGNEADRARVARRLCVERGWLYLVARGECVERQIKPGG